MLEIRLLALLQQSVILTHALGVESEVGSYGATPLPLMPEST